MVIIEVDNKSDPDALKAIEDYVNSTLKSRVVFLERIWGFNDKVNVTVLAKPPLYERPDTTDA